MDNKTYWAKRIAELEAFWHEKSKQTIEKELALYYRQGLTHLEGKIHELYQRFARDNGIDMVAAQRLIHGDEFRVWRMDILGYVNEIQRTGSNELLRELNTLAMRSRISRLEQLHAETLVELGKLAGKTNESVDKFLSEAYRDCHDRSLFDFGKTIGIKDTGVKVEREQVEAVLRTPWNGKNYSARIWKNAKKLGGVIQKEIVGGMHRGADVEEMTRNVMRAMNVGKKEAVRLVRTELNYVQNRAIARSIEDSGLEWYRFVAVLDGRTSPMCRAHDGKEYRLDDYTPGTNAPPLHPHCRSMIIASFGDGESISSLRSARDRKGNYIRVPAEMRYNEWHKKFIEETVPRFKTVPMEQVAKERTVEEFTKLANEYKPVVEEYAGRESKWSGKIVLANGAKEFSGKMWNCSIRLLNYAPPHVLIHELVHSCSISYFNESEFWANMLAEEIPIHLLSQEIVAGLGLDVVESAYDNATQMLRKYKTLLHLEISDAEFAKQLIQLKPSQRWDWLGSIDLRNLSPSVTIADIQEAQRIIGRLLEWDETYRRERKKY